MCNKEPPFEKWHPPYCGDIDIRIKQDGSWWYMGTPIERESLVNLFSSILIFENNDYFLKTPAEVVRIKVDDAPFVITQWHLHQTSEGDVIEIITNLGTSFLLSQTHPLVLESDPTGTPKPYVILNRGLKALVHRNVYYQWIDLCTLKSINGTEHLLLKSGINEFSLGSLGG